MAIHIQCVFDSISIRLWQTVYEQQRKKKMNDDADKSREKKTNN